MKVLKYVPILFLVLFLSGCASSGSADNELQLGDYTFVMYEGTSKVASGILSVNNITIKSNNTPYISGTYTINKETKMDLSWLSSMGGEFSGDANYTQGKIFINTNPRIADANVFFNLTIYSTFYEGEWNYSTFRGPTNRGRLKVVLKK